MQRPEKHEGESKSYLNVAIENLTRVVGSCSTDMLCYLLLDVFARRHVGYFENMTSADQTKDGRSRGIVHRKRN